jgi:hypothetical protein
MWVLYNVSQKFAMVKNMRPFFLYVGTRPFGEKVIIFAKNQ